MPSARQTRRGRAEQVGGHREIAVSRMFEEERSAAVRLFADPVGNRGNFHDWIDRNRYAGDFTIGFGEGDEFVQGKYRPV